MDLKENTHKLPGSNPPGRIGYYLTGPFAFLGRSTINWVNNMGASAIFLILAFLKIFHPKQWSKIIQQIYYIGARSTLIIMLVSLFTGMVIGLQSYTALVKFGAQGALFDKVLLLAGRSIWGMFLPVKVYFYRKIRVGDTVCRLAVILMAPSGSFFG